MNNSINKYKLIESKINNYYKHEHFNAIFFNNNNLETKQNINIITKTSDDINVTVWSSFKDGLFKKMSVIDLAKDFEKCNPLYSVEVAFNADYFYYDGQSVNANIIFNNRVIKASNHFKYSSLELNKNGLVVNHYKETVLNSELVYRIDNIIMDKISLVNLNKEKIDLDKYNYYSISNYNLNIIDEHFYLEGIITNYQETDSYILKTVKDSPFTFLNKSLKVQYEIKDFNIDNTMVGIDTILIKNNRRLEFNELTGQSYEHNSQSHPRTAFGYNSKGEFKVITVDGRLDESVGVNLLDLSKIMQENGFVEGYNFDGGGSTQLVIKNDKDVLETVNLPSEYPLRPVGNIILLIKKKW